MRGLVGYMKYQLAYKNVKFQPAYFSAMVGLSSVVGVLITWAVVMSDLQLPFISDINPAIAFIIGYAGGDIIENLYKMLLGKTSLYPVK